LPEYYQFEDNLNEPARIPPKALSIQNLTFKSLIDIYSKAGFVGVLEELKTLSRTGINKRN
jgi:hypothetical protein